MTSKIKVDNINKVSDDTNIIKKCGTTTTIGSGASNPIVVDGSAVTLGRCGGTVALASGATQTGFGRTGTVNWVTTKKTTGFTAVSGEGYFCDTAASGAFTLTLPSSPSAGDIVGLKDYNGNFGTANLTIGRNSQPINGANTADVVVQTAGASIFLVYVDASQGWVATQDDSSTFAGESFICASVSGACNSIVTSGDFKTAVFKGPGTFTVSTAGPISNLLVVGGGGGGGAADIGAGGGAGGFRLLSCLTTPAAAYPITIGGGGAAQTSLGQGNNGVNTVATLASTYTSAGGGGGGGSAPPYTAVAGSAGGSGGGGANAGGAGGAGNTPPVSPPQGNDGALGAGGTPQQPGVGGGGGGAGAAATPVPTTANPPGFGGAGGAGTSVAPTFGSPPQPFYTANQSNRGVTACGTFAGGGGGAGDGPGGAQGGVGGAGGGGLGSSPSPGGPGLCGTANSGGGGGAGENTRGNGAAGGSGIVLIRYKFQ